MKHGCILIKYNEIKFENTMQRLNFVIRSHKRNTEKYDRQTTPL